MLNDKHLEKSIAHRRAEIEVLPFYLMKVMSLEQDIIKLENYQLDVNEMRKRAKGITNIPDFVIAVADSEYLRGKLLIKYKQELEEWKVEIKRLQ